MKKDITIEQVFDSAEKCLRVGIHVIFNFIIGFPNEPEESIAETLRVAKALRAMSPDFDVSIFYFKPYPGNEIADLLLAQGYEFPRTLEGWAEFDYVASSSPWIPRETYQLIEGLILSANWRESSGPAARATSGLGALALRARSLRLSG